MYNNDEQDFDFLDIDHDRSKTNSRYLLTVIDPDLLPVFITLYYH